MEMFLQPHQATFHISKWKFVIEILVKSIALGIIQIKFATTIFQGPFKTLFLLTIWMTTVLGLSFVRPLNIFFFNIQKPNSKFKEQLRKNRNQQKLLVFYCLTNLEHNNFEAWLRFLTVRLTIKKSILLIWMDNISCVNC